MNGQCPKMSDYFKGEFGSVFLYYTFWKSDDFKRCGMKLGFFKKRVLDKSGLNVASLFISLTFWKYSFYIHYTLVTNQWSNKQFPKCVIQNLLFCVKLYATSLLYGSGP